VAELACLDGSVVKGQSTHSRESNMSTRKKAIAVVLIGLAATFTAKPKEVSAAGMQCGQTYCGVSCWDLLFACFGCGNTACQQGGCEGENGRLYAYEMTCSAME